MKGLDQLKIKEKNKNIIINNNIIILKLICFL